MVVRTFCVPRAGFSPETFSAVSPTIMAAANQALEVGGSPKALAA
jgi:hypothetical protein